MSEKENVQFVQEGFAAFEKGDIKTLLEGFTEDVEIRQPGPKDIIPFAGIYRGPEQAAQYFKTMVETQEFKQFEVREFVAQANKVVVIGYEQINIKSTGRSVDVDWVIFDTFSSHSYIMDFLGGTPEEIPGRYTKASPLTYVSKDDPPVLTIQGDEDLTVQPIQAELLDKKLNEVEVSHTLIIKKGKGHGILVDHDVWEFFDKHLK